MVMARVHLSLTLAALLVLAGCTGGGTAPSTTDETTEEATTLEATQTAGTTDSATEGETATSTNSSTLGADDEAFEENVSKVLSEMESQWNYTAGGDLDANETIRRHVLALGDVESVTIRTTSREEGGNRTYYSNSVTKATESRELYRTNGSVLGTMVRYTEGNQSYLKMVRENETHYAELGTPNVSEETSQNLSTAVIALDLLDLWLAPYEEAGTVTRNGTTLTKYEATGPGYYAEGATGNRTVASFSGTVLIDEDGLVRYFHREIVYERDGVRTTSMTTVQYVDVNATEVERPDWLDEFEDHGDEGEDE